MNQGLLEALARPGVVTSAAVLFLLSAATGFYAVPLYAILQHDAPEAMKARMIGANNVVNSVMIVAGAAVLTPLSSGFGLSVAMLATLLGARKPPGCVRSCCGSSRASFSRRSPVRS